MGEEEPCLGAFDGFLPILGEPSAAPEPSEGTLDDPAAGQNKTSKPSDVSERLTIWIVQRPIPIRAVRSFGPA